MSQEVGGLTCVRESEPGQQTIRGETLLQTE